MLNDVKAMLKRSAERRAIMFKQAAAASAADTVGASAVTGAAACRLAAALVSGLASAARSRPADPYRSADGAGAAAHAQIPATTAHRRKITVALRGLETGAIETQR